MKILCGFILLITITFYGCDYQLDSLTPGENLTSQFSTIHRIKNKPLTSIYTDWSSTVNIHSIDSELDLMCQFSRTKHEFSIVDLSKDEVTHVIRAPNEIEIMGSICIVDTAEFAFLTDTTFYLYKDEKFIKIIPSYFEDDYIPLKYIGIRYFPEENKIISGALTYKRSIPNQPPYSSYFLNIYDLTKMESTLIPFSYPEQYHGNKLGIPKVYLSDWENNLIVSFELDDNVYQIDLLTNKIDTIECRSQISNVKDGYYPKDGDKQSKLDAMLKNNLAVGGYGKAFYNPDNNMMYRLYRPGMSIKDRYGKFYSGPDRGLHVLELDLSNNNITEIQLANGQYYVSNNWSFNRFNNTLIYPKLEEHVTQKNFCLYNLHNININNR